MLYTDIHQNPIETACDHSDVVYIPNDDNENEVFCVCRLCGLIVEVMECENIEERFLI